MTACPLVDSHCHLDFPDFAEDLEEVMARAGRAGVSRMVTIGTYLSRMAPIFALAERFPEVWCTVGVHPHNVAEELTEATEERLEALLTHPRVVGIGETGLDYFYDKSPRPAQQESFRRHIRVAMRSGLPLVVHTRDAEDDTMRLLREETAGGAPVCGLLHCFSGSAALADAALDFGFYLSFSGILSFKKTDALRAVAARTPLERILVETDAPYLAPVPHRGKRNEPAYVAHTAALLAELKGVPLATLAAATTANFERLFRRAGSGGECA